MWRGRFDRRGVSFVRCISLGPYQVPGTELGPNTPTVCPSEPSQQPCTEGLVEPTVQMRKPRLRKSLKKEPGLEGPKRGQHWAGTTEGAILAPHAPLPPRASLPRAP